MKLFNHTDPERDKLHEKAVALQQQKPGMTYAEALAQVGSETAKPASRTFKDRNAHLLPSYRNEQQQKFADTGKPTQRFDSSSKKFFTPVHRR